MSLESGLRDLLLADATIAALVSTRAYPLGAPADAAAPFITWQVISATPVQSLAGSNDTTGATVQIDCWSEALERGGSYAQAKALAEAVRLALADQNGVSLGNRQAWISLQDSRDDIDDGTRMHRVSMDFRIWHRS